MPMSTPIVNSADRLAPADWNRLQELLGCFEATFEDSSSSMTTTNLNHYLPAAGDPLRTLTLLELIKSDLEFQWRRGTGPLVEAYLERYPEIGGRSTLPASVLCEEYHVRHRFGDKPPLATYQTRFPRQFPELERLVAAE